MLVDTPAVRFVLDAAGAVSMFEVVGAVADSRDAAFVTAALTAVVLSSRLRRRVAAHRRRSLSRSSVGPTHPTTARTAHPSKDGTADHGQAEDTGHAPSQNPPPHRRWTCSSRARSRGAVAPRIRLTRHATRAGGSA
ncbi:hypothetical protein CH253_18175 [Rhodococcus sp. 06-156-3C]|nr:hypothetical protein CH248_27375 [Rhodococcus sp. 06-156-4a]OZD17863.1 hypothetical protein CH253_18175 [Rhodococcus sp. 06-156-3C]OZD20589.1 hypothetical protein CH280_03330 [Rhodococcus sp. 06-156-4C]OZD30693.1 hypothetical protein CH247_15400 [Rhodococcus sp. 06-156-3b]OZD32533.1 hypothetical protein CH284_19860 [Rhodococcus sp. 06-156-3]OZF65056.1 hypothetical protein CH290_10725 [Rhodococcus sp. 06-156-4]